jgi:hypothetical protein
MDLDIQMQDTLLAPDSDLLMRQKSTQYAFVSPATNLLPPTLWDNRGPFPFPYPL